MGILVHPGQQFKFEQSLWKTIRQYLSLQISTNPTIEKSTPEYKSWGNPCQETYT